MFDTLRAHETNAREFRPNLLLYVAVGAVAGAIIALQICIMRLFAVGSWAHFGSLVVSLAMLAFGWASALMCVARGPFERRWFGVCAASLLLFGPLAVGASLVAQRLPFNAVFIVSDPAQKWRLLANFLLYFLPFLAGAFFLGTVFLKAKESFNRFYFADLVGSGLCGMAFLAATYLLLPENLMVAPLAMWGIGAAAWFSALGAPRAAIGSAALAAVTVAAYLALPAALDTPKLAVSDYKGVSYVRKFPDTTKVYENVSPFGHLEIYASSYLHFAPGLSDNAAFNLPEMPKDAFLGLYIDGEGPAGIIRDLPASQTGYFRYLPIIYPYLIKSAPETFVVQFGGGISTVVALQGGARQVTVAEGNPEVLRAFRNPSLRAFTGDILANPKIRTVSIEGRLHLAHTADRFDVIDLSLADSAGLSSPGGFAIVEKFAYTREAMASYMRALRDGGILSVTLWNKEEPPKSVLKLYRTMAEAARGLGPVGIARDFLVVSSYLSTATVLYKRGGFTDPEIATLRAHTRAMSFDEIYYPGIAFDESATDGVLENYRNQLFFDQAGLANADPAGSPDPVPADAAGPTDGAPAEGGVLPSTTMGRLAWQRLVGGGFEDIARRYVFDTRPLTNDQPYFAAYVKPADLPKVTDRLDLLQDEWGYLLIWATLGIAAVAALSLVLLPVAIGWRSTFARSPGKALTIVYFACLGLGYIMVEIGMIAAFNLGLANPTISVTVLITSMLIFSGLGSFVSERIVDGARVALPAILVAIAAMLAGYTWLLDPFMDAIGTQPYGWRLVLCALLIAPPAFLMGFPMPTAMGWLTRLEKDSMFVWAWGINGSFSVLGAAAVPVLATSFGLNSVLLVAAAAYLVAIPAFFGILLPPFRPQPNGSLAWA